MVASPQTPSTKEQHIEVGELSGQTGFSMAFGYLLQVHELLHEEVDSHSM